MDGSNEEYAQMSPILKLKLNQKSGVRFNPLISPMSNIDARTTSSERPSTADHCITNRWRYGDYLSQTEQYVKRLEKTIRQYSPPKDSSFKPKVLFASSTAEGGPTKSEKQKTIYEITKLKKHICHSASQYGSNLIGCYPEMSRLCPSMTEKPINRFSTHDNPSRNTSVLSTSEMNPAFQCNRYD